MSRAEPLKGKLYYRIGEVAKMFNVNPSVIRYWEKEFPTLRPRKNRSGTRNFTRQDIEQLRYIHYLLKDQGHTIEGAKKLIRQKQSDEAFRFQLVEQLEKMKGFLTELKAGLD